nr:CRISPR-associated protein Cas4 [Candidatus Freyarchaeota archaeon]
MTEKQGINETPYILQSGKIITGTLVWYYHVCEREVWLMGREITPDEDYEALDMGRAVHEIHYPRMKREIALDGIKIDIIKGQSKTICEVKTSSKYLNAAKMQLSYYLYRLKEAGIDTTGEILIPKEKKKIEITLTPELEGTLLNTLGQIRYIVEQELPPPPTKSPFCRNCAYKDMCWT